MPEFRKDPISDRWVIIATERAKRPIHPEAADTALCPFCAGNENMTPPEVMVFRDLGRLALITEDHDLRRSHGLP